MSTLTGNKISLTYKSLIKTSDNDVLTGALKELSDGLGNNSGVFLNTGGDLKSTGTLEFSNFKATAYAVTINKLVNEADGISNNDNDTSLPTSAAVKDYVDTHVTSQDLDFSDGTNPGAVDLDSQVFAIVGTSNEIETSASGQQLQIGLPNDVTISGTYTGTTFSGDLNGTINTATTAVTQTAGDNSTKVATTAYVDTLDAASDLDFSDGSVNSAVNLNTQVFSIQGTSNEITTTASGQSLTIALDSTGVDLPDGSTAITQTAGDNSTKVATTAYVDVLDAASDLDIAGDTGTGDVNLNTQTLTLQGTTNQVITAVSGQTTTFSLPSTVHRDLQGNVTGNADTATAWQTARDLSLSGEATGILSSVDGTSNISGAVTLTNSAVTGKVLTGLPTPAASTVQASDSILEGIGKLQSQINGIANGLQFQGTWDAATNTPTLNSGGGEVDSGTTTGQTADKLIDSSQNFLTTVSVGDKVINQVDGQSALVTNVDSNTSLSLDADIMLSGEAYTIDASPFLVQGHYYVVSVGGTTSLNGNANWAIGDWVIAGADNIWSKLDHTQIDGQGTPGNLPVWNTATTLTDSIVSESGTALTVTGSLSTTLGASVTGDFAVNTNKFTVNATTGDSVIAGNLNFPDDKRIRLGDSNDFQIYYDSAAQAGQGEAIISESHIRLESSFFNLGSSTKTAIATDANNYVRLYHGGNQKLSTISTGIDITGAVNADSATFTGDGDILSVNRGSFNVVTNLTSVNHNIVSTGKAFNIKTSDSNNLTFLTNNTTALTIDTSQNATFAGDVGIGVTGTPTTKLHLGGTAPGDSIIRQDSTASGTNWEIGERAAGKWQIFEDDTDSVVATFMSSGNVGIGNDDPSYKLSVNSGVANVGIKVVSTDSSSTIAFKDDTTTGDNVQCGAVGNDFKVLAGGATRLKVTSNGNLEVLGTNSGASNTQMKLIFDNSDVTVQTNQLMGGIEFKSADGSGQGAGIKSSINTVFTGTGGYNDMIFSTAGTDANNAERMRIDSSGIVSVTNSADAILKVETSSGTSSSRLFLKSPTREWRIGVNDSFNSGSLFVYNTEANTYPFLIDTSGNVGIGTDSPNQEGFGSGNIALSVKAPSSGGVANLELIGLGNNEGDEVGYVNFMSQNATDSLASIVGLRRSDDAIGKLDFRTAGTSKFTIEDDNQIRFVGDFYFASNTTNGTDTGSLNFSGGGGFGHTRGASIGLSGNEDGNGGLMQLIAGNGATSEIRSYTSGIERMRITGGGDVLFGTQGLPNGTSVYGSAFHKSTVDRMILRMASSTTVAAGLIDFFNPNGQVGYIATNGSSTQYVTSSDYRLKEDLKDFAGLDMVSKISVYDFKWKTDESRSYGVMAHELQEVLPDAVSGDKDAEEMQGVDYSKIVPLLVKSIQELKAEVDLLKQECKCK